MELHEIANFDEATVAALTTKKVFARGEALLEEDALFDAMQEDGQLRASCQGSDLEPYEVRARLSAVGVEETACSCPYEYDGLCKHLVALLLAWLHTPEVFATVAPLREALTHKKRDELIELIETMIEQEPRLRSLITFAKGDISVDKNALRRSIRGVIKRAQLSGNWDYEAQGMGARQFAREMEKFLNLAHARRRAQGAVAACAIATTILRELTASYDDLQHLDENGEVCVVADGCVAEIDIALQMAAKGATDEKPGRKNQSIENDDWRHETVEVLVTATLRDVEIGGRGFAENAFDLVLQHASDEDHELVEARLRAFLQRPDNSSASQEYDSWQTKWVRSQMVALLSRAAEKWRGGTAAADVVREMGTPDQRAFLMIGEGRIEEALMLARRHIGDAVGMAQSFAEALVQHGHNETAQSWMIERTKNEGRAAHASGWLAEHFAQLQQFDEATKWREKVWQAFRLLPSYVALRADATRAGNWDAVRHRVLDGLKNDGEWALRLDIALHEGDAEHALKLLGKVTKWERASRLQAVAQAVKSAQPQAALKLFQEAAAFQIARKERSAYREAVRLLGGAKTLMTQLHGADAWEKFVAQLRETHKPLRALHDELKKAGW